jgi:SNF2 family DNA or RNA helicase
MYFNWWRIIADEAHEIMTYDDRFVKGKGKNKTTISGSQGLHTLSRFKSRFRWYVTGTPFPHKGKSLRAALKVLI